MEHGLVTVEYVDTTQQCADPLTKFLKGGPQQVSMRLQLALREVGKAQASRNVRICRVSASETNLISLLKVKNFNCAAISSHQLSRFVRKLPTMVGFD